MESHGYAWFSGTLQGGVVRSNDLVEFFIQVGTSVRHLLPVTGIR